MKILDFESYKLQKEKKLAQVEKDKELSAHFAAIEKIFEEARKKCHD